MSTGPQVKFNDLSQWHEQLSPVIFRELEALVKDSEFIGGKRLSSFEKAFGSYCGARHGIGCSNGTDAISLALRAAGVRAGDEVITVANTFIATVEAILAIGAKPVLVDAEDSSALIDLARVEAAITARTRAVLPVHLYGTPVNLESVQALCVKHKLALVQDAAQAFGARWNGRPLVEFGEAQTYSFFPGKNLGAWGDAGGVVTNSDSVAATVKMERNHGRAEAQKYLHESPGGNFRMDPVQAVVLSAKLPEMEAKNEKRRSMAKRFREELNGVGDLRMFRIDPKASPVHHLFVVRTSRRDKLQAFLQREGIACGIHYPVPLHLQPALAHLGLRKGAFPVSEAHAGEILSLPFYPEMPEAHVGILIAALRKFF